jgi:hypothetical protein
MNRAKMQIIRFAANLKMPTNVYKRAQYEATLDDIYVKLIVVPLQKAFREKYPPYDPKRPFCPNPRDCHFGKTPYLHDGYCPVCDDTCFCFYCGKLIVNTADWELSISGNRHLCSICRREEEIEDFKLQKSMYGR